MINRHNIVPRQNWQTTVENLGMNYHTIEGKTYWNESACYELSSDLVDKIESATQELHDMCLLYVDAAVKSGNYEGYGFDDNTINLIEKSWQFGHQHIYGRFDLGINKNGDIKMFEYNADTPTSLLEAAVIQWNWKEEVFPEMDQFNSIHENLIERFRAFRIPHMYFTTMADAPFEDWGNLHYLLACQSEAGYNASSIDLESVGFDEANGQFVDMNNNPIEHLFKLYPWEYMVKDDFANRIGTSNTYFYEPIWKMLLSNKLLCVKLWERHPNHPFLLEAYTNDTFTNQTIDLNRFLIKPMLGREGQGIRSAMFSGFSDNNKVLTGGNVNEIYQEKFHVATFGSILPVIGSWVIGNKACGIGIREDVGITTNNSQFVPHYFS